MNIPGPENLKENVDPEVGSRGFGRSLQALPCLPYELCFSGAGVHLVASCPYSQSEKSP